MCIKIKLNKSSKCRHCVGVLGSNPDSSPIVSQSLININERSTVMGSAGYDGKEQRDFISPFTFPSSPSHQCRNSLPQPFLDRLQNSKRRLRTSQWSNQAGGTQLKGLIPILQRTGTVFLIRQFPPRKSIFLDRQRYSALLFKLNETAFFFGDKYCCYIKLALNITVSSLISRIKTIGRVFSLVFIRYKDTH